MTVATVAVVYVHAKDLGSYTKILTFVEGEKSGQGLLLSLLLKLSQLQATGKDSLCNAFLFHLPLMSPPFSAARYYELQLYHLKQRDYGNLARRKWCSEQIFYQAVDALAVGRSQPVVPKLGVVPT